MQLFFAEKLNYEPHNPPFKNEKNQAKEGKESCRAPWCLIKTWSILNLINDHLSFKFLHPS